MMTETDVISTAFLCGGFVILIGAGFLALDIFQLSFFQDFNKGIGGRK